MISKHSKVILGWIFLGALIGIATTELTYAYLDSKDATPPETVSLMIVDGTNIHNWPNIERHEGESVADVIDRVSRLDNFPVTWSGEGINRTLSATNNSTSGSWQYYIDQFTPNVPLAKFYPKSGDQILIIKTR